MQIIRITQMEVRGPHELWLRFNDGRQATVNLAPLLDGPVFAPLRDPAYFAQVKLNSECGTITWPNGVDLAPEALYDLVQVSPDSQRTGTQAGTQGVLFPEYFSEEEKKKLTGQPRPLRFVTLLHDASSLHYDFRLEFLGVLKSWVLPKGPSIRADEKRHAKRVNDHGLSSLRDGAERVIPPGNYGAGTVLIWDRGNFYLRDVKGKKATIAAMHAGLKQGSLRLILEGEKLKGEFTLFKRSSGKDQGWLLVKEQDEFASDEDVTLQNRSVVSEKTLEEVATSPGWWTRLKK